MKKLIAVLLVSLAVACTLTACQNNGAVTPAQTADQTVSDNAEQQSSIANPLVESTADEVAQKLGFALAVPEGAENVQYFILSGDTEELRFTLDGLDYTARLKATDGFEDISGMYYEWTQTLDDELKGRPCKQMRYSGDEGDIDVCLWYDVVPGLMYSITTSDSSLDGFDITAAALQVFEPVQQEQTDEQEQSSVANPLVESTADEVAQKLGFSLAVPEGAENVQYFILTNDTEELRFTLDGLDYTARLKATDGFEDISGMNYEWTDTLDDELKGRQCRQMRYCGDEGDIDVCLWYDVVPGLM